MADKAPLPSGYGENTSVTQALALLIPGGALPKETELRALAAWTEELEAELQALIAKRTSDPALLLRVTKALMTTTGTLSGEVAAAIEAVGPDSVSKLLADREAARVARAAAKAIADGLFDGSAVPNLGNESWRQMLSHARQFALEAFPAAEAPPLASPSVLNLDIRRAPHALRWDASRAEIPLLRVLNRPYVLLLGSSAKHKMIRAPGAALSWFHELVRLPAHHASARGQVSRSAVL